VDPVRWRGKSCHPFLRVRVCDSSPLLLNAAVELRSIGAASAHGVPPPLTQKGKTLDVSDTNDRLRVLRIG
jgi:hypothetical protein